MSIRMAGRGLPAVAALAGLACLGVAAPATASSRAALTGLAWAGGARAGAAALGPRAVLGAQLWAARYNGPGNGGDVAQAMAVSPDGRSVFVTGQSWGGPGTGNDYATVAYDAVTGRQLWASRYSGPAHHPDYPWAIAVSPDGRSVFVTGSVGAGVFNGDNYATVAYDAATGRRLWVSRYNAYNSVASSVAVSPDGATVFVTGASLGHRVGYAYATVAYDAGTGRQLWVSLYNGPADEWDNAWSVAVSPDGSAVFVTGASTGRRTGIDYATVAYRAATGGRLWVSRYSGPGNGFDSAFSVAVSPAGGRVFVTGESQGRGTGDDYATVAYRAATGRRLWVSRYNGLGNGAGAAQQVAVSPAGDQVFVTGMSQGRGTGVDYATVAYRAATGRRLWVSRYNGPGNGDDVAFSVAVSPGGATVFVTGESTGRRTSNDYATVAYRAATGRQVWVSRYNGGGATCVAVSPGGRRVFVTGVSTGRGTGGDYGTVAYRG